MQTGTATHAKDGPDQPEEVKRVFPVHGSPALHHSRRLGSHDANHCHQGGGGLGACSESSRSPRINAEAAGSG